jgi:hypothetical protein
VIGREAGGKVTVLAIGHHRRFGGAHAEVEALADRVGILVRGRLTDLGTPAALLASMQRTQPIAVGLHWVEVHQHRREAHGEPAIVAQGADSQAAHVDEQIAGGDSEGGDGGGDGEGGGGSEGGRGGRRAADGGCGTGATDLHHRHSCCRHQSQHSPDDHLPRPPAHLKECAEGGQAGQRHAMQTS